MQDNVAQSVLNKQRLDKFRMVLTLPNVLRDLDTSNWNTTSQDTINRDSLQFSLQSATLPEVSIPAKPIPTMGQVVKVTSQVRDPYQPISCKFTVDNRFRNYFVLWKWLEAINNPIHSGMDDSLALKASVPQKGIISDPKNTDFWGYQTIISIFPLDEYNEDLCEFIFTHSFITKLSGITFNYQDNAQIECDFTFEFGQMDLQIKE